MPTARGSSDAIAVEAWVGHELNSAYTFLLEQIVLLTWGGIVLIAVLASMKKYEHDHPSRSIYTKMWDQRSSPFGILKLTTNHFMKPNHSRWLLLVWLAVALAFLMMKYAIPIVFARYIIIDNAAPVASEAIYVPSYQGDAAADLSRLLEIYAAEVPSVLRAAGSVEAVNSTGSAVAVDQPEILPDQGNGTGVRINYRYKVTGLDFGLQKYSDLVLNVEGSCITEYTWLSSSGTVSLFDFQVYLDTYHLFNDPYEEIQVSINDGSFPLGYFRSDPAAHVPPSNTSWAAIVSSVDRQSTLPSTDPWYLTEQSPNSTTDYKVRAGRPALSCWQNDVWSYRGYNSTVIGLNSTMLPGLDLPVMLQEIFAHFLGEPKIVTLGTRLGASALKSASTSLGGYFHASTSSVYSDLERLVFASYIATANTLTDTTLFSTDSGIENQVVDPVTLLPFAGVDEFVIWSSSVVTLSVKAIIIIPVLAAALWIVFIGVLLLPIPIFSALTVTVSVGNTEAGPKKESNVTTQETSKRERVANDALQQLLLSTGDGDV